MNYLQKLQDPRWQRVRLEVLGREDFTCERCGATDKTLHVHHGYYKRGLEPWEYEQETLHCLCRDCHDFVGARIARIHHVLALLPTPCLGGALQALGDYALRQVERTA